MTHTYRGQIDRRVFDKEKSHDPAFARANTERPLWSMPVGSNAFQEPEFRGVESEAGNCAAYEAAVQWVERVQL